MPSTDRATSRVRLRSALERDVYQAAKKLEASNNDKPFRTISALYDAIRRSNSSLGRLKKRPLEDAIDQVLQFRKQELTDSDDSEADLDQPEPVDTSDQGFLLNRQMTKLWRADATPRSDADQPATKKRRLPAEDEEKNDRASGTESAVAAPNDAVAPVNGQEKAQAKKLLKSNRFRVEAPDRIPPLAGVGHVYAELLRHTWGLLRWHSLYQDRNWRPTPGILLAGPSGTGKKSLVKSLAAKLGVSLISLTGCLDDPERMEKSLSEAFETAITLAPCIIFVDQIDLYMPRPGSSSHGEYHSRATRLFMDQMQRMQSGSERFRHVLAMATTSRLADVDPAVLRLGFFEKIVSMRIPDGQARQDILRAVTRKLHLSDDVNLSELAHMTHGFVGADLAAVTSLATDRVAERITRREDPNDAMIELHTQSFEVDGDEALFFTRTMANPPVPGAVTMEDFKVAIKGFTPSLRKEGFTVIPDVTWDQVGALDKARRQLQTSIIGPIRNPDLYRNFGLTRPAGVLLWGPPGCGKTLVAQAVANEAQASFILINGPELLNKYVGESERAVRELFQRARTSRPCILFFDEIDSIVPPRRNSSTESGARVVNALLTELDGAQDRTGIYVIGTTNRPDMIDEAMLRPGRLSVQLLVDLPTPAERADILRAVYRTCHEEEPSEEMLKLLTEVALDERCTNFSGADLSGLHTKAAECALERWLAADGGGGAQVINRADWEHALDHTQASVKDPASYRVRDEKTASRWRS